MAARREYSDEERAACLAALDANGGDLSRTARDCGVPRKTLEAWARKRLHPDVAKLRQRKKKGLAEKLDELAYKLADAAPAKIKAAGLQATLTSLAIAIDKAKLLRQSPPPRPGDAPQSPFDLSRLNAKELADFDYLVARATGADPGAARAG
jgi:transposase-like protein